eukprot:6189765-Pleurochrysis_carterae.AAC.1
MRLFPKVFGVVTATQHVDKRQSVRTLTVLSYCGCGHDTLLWMKEAAVRRFLGCLVVGSTKDI